MAVAVGDVFKFALEQRLFGQQIINTFALKVLAVPADTTELVFMNTLWLNDDGYFNSAGQLRKTILSIQSPFVSHLQWIVSRVTPNPTLATTYPLVDDVLGTLGDSVNTANTAMAIIRKGLNAGRRNRGRIAIAGIDDEYSVDGKWSNLRVADGNTIGAKMVGTFTPVAGYSFTMGFWSPLHTGKVQNVNVNYPAQYVACVSAQAKATVRVQRSRTVGVGA